MKHYLRHLTLSILVLFFLPTADLAAEKIYKKIGKDGVTHYSSKPIEGSKEADLPQIMRGERKLPAAQLLSCGEHAGIDCEAGPDKDGSVVCTDGFRDSAQRFSFSCSAPKLQISEISPMHDDGGFSVIIRNSKSVSSQKTEVMVKFPEAGDKKLEGPSEIKGFEAGEYRYVPEPREQLRFKSDPALAALAFRPQITDVTVTCANCP